MTAIEAIEILQKMPPNTFLWARNSNNSFSPLSRVELESKIVLSDPEEPPRHCAYLEGS